MALRQPDGYYRITGRIKEMIVRGGENIAPHEIEELLYQHPKVQQVQIVGVPDRKFGEEVLAWIKLGAGESATAGEIRDFCRRRLAHFKTPRYVKFVESFPTTSTARCRNIKSAGKRSRSLACRTRPRRKRRNAFPGLASEK